MAGAIAGSFWSGTRAAVTDSVPKLVVVVVVGGGGVCLWFPPSLVQTFLVSRWPAKVMQAPVSSACGRLSCGARVLSWVLCPASCAGWFYGLCLEETHVTSSHSPLSRAEGQPPAKEGEKLVCREGEGTRGQPS